MTQIPVLDLTWEIEALWDELNSAVQQTLRSGRFILGPNVQAFEDEIASYLGVKHAVGVNSGTDALVIGLRAFDVGPGDEVVTTPFTFFATAEAVSIVGATPVFVDIDPRTFNLDPSLLEAAIGPRTRAILPVHLYGQGVDMDPVLDIANRYGLHILEDTAQAMGGRYKGRKLGTLGDIGAFSFFPSKNLGCFGDGGLVVTNDDRLAETVRKLRAHGSLRKYYNEVLGYNSRLDELQAAILRVKLPHLDGWNESRRQIAARYDRLLDGFPEVAAPHQAAHGRHVYHQYTIRVTGGRRDAVQQRLTEAGVGTMVYYPVPVHKLPVYKHLRYSLPKAERAAGEVLSLPIGPEVKEIDRVLYALRTALVRETGVRQWKDAA